MRETISRIATPSLVTLALMSAVPASWAQELLLVQVLARTTDHVSELTDQLSGVVAEERYEQRSSAPAESGFGAFRSDTRERRVLRSDYLLFQTEGSDRYH